MVHECSHLLGETNCTLWLPHVRTEHTLAALAYLDTTRRDVLMAMVSLVSLVSLRLTRGLDPARGTRDVLPPGLVLDAACVARLKTTQHLARAEIALASIEDVSLLAAVQALPASAARTAALQRIRAHVAAQAGGLSLPRPTQTGALRIADEVEKPLA